MQDWDELMSLQGSSTTNHVRGEETDKILTQGQKDGVIALLHDINPSHTLVQETLVYQYSLVKEYIHSVVQTIVTFISYNII